MEAWTMIFLFKQVIFSFQLLVFRRRNHHQSDFLIMLTHHLCQYPPVRQQHVFGLRPVIGGKVLAVSNTQFTIRELGDNAVEEGSARGTQWAYNFLQGPTLW